MLDFVNQVTSELNIDEKTARSASGGLLGLIQQKADSGDFQSLLSALPGASDLMREAPQASAQSGSSPLGSLAGAASSLLGGKLGGSLGALSVLGDAGLDLDDIPKFASSFLGFAKGKAGNELLGSVLKNLPELKKFL